MSGTKLSADQVIKALYNEGENRLRVDAELTSSVVSQEVIISDVDDSIKIGDASGNYVKVESDGSINVNAVIIPVAGAAVSILQTVGNDALTTIHTTLGSPFQMGGSIANTAFIANAGTSLNTSALALESGGHLASIDSKLTSPLITNATLQIGSAIVGKVGIDQTTPGTTNGVQINTALPTGTNSIGQVTANAGSGSFTVAQPTGTNLHTVVDSSVLPTGASTGALQITGNNTLTTINTTLGSPFQAGASIGNTAFIVNAGTNLNTSALALDASITNFSTKFGSLGQKTMVGSAPVVISSDQTIIPVSGTFFQVTQPISAITLPLPTGAATSTKQSDGSQKTQNIDATGAVVGPVMISSGVNYAPVYLPLDFSGTTLNITTQDIASASASGYGGQQFFLGNPTTNSTAAYTLNSIQTVMVLIKGIWTGTLSIETSEDGGITWVPRSIHVVGTSIYSSSITSNVVGSLNASAKTNVRIRAITAVTGTANISILVSDNPSNVYIANAIKLIDGSSPTSTTQMSIKAASTAAVATDPAIVVTISPNNTPILPSGAATSALQTTNNASLASIDSDIDVALSTRSSLANQINGTQKTQIVDASGNIFPSGDIVGRASFIRITDGVDAAEVKPASTAALATDPALVVAISPNNIIITSSKSSLTPSSPTGTSVGLTSAQAVASNVNRKGLVLINTSIAAISFGLGATAVLNSGITLYPGDSWIMDEFTFTTVVINAIASLAASNLGIQEFA